MVTTHRCERINFAKRWRYSLRYNKERSRNLTYRLITITIFPHEWLAVLLLESYLQGGGQVARQHQSKHPCVSVTSWTLSLLLMYLKQLHWPNIVIICLKIIKITKLQYKKLVNHIKKFVFELKSMHIITRKT